MYFLSEIYLSFELFINVSRETFNKNNFILVVFNIEETIYKCYNIQALFIVLII